MKAKTILALRTCDKDLRSHDGFQWKAKGVVKCDDFEPAAKYGNGLHALEWGIGDGSLLDWDAAAKWLVIEVKATDVIQLNDKIKFPACKVVHCGDRKSATDFLLAANDKLQGVVGSFVTAGDKGTATAGDEGTATAGDEGTATAGDEGTATAGDEGTATAGDEGTATAGYRGTLIIEWWDGNRYRLSVAYVNEKGIEPNVAYKLNDKGAFVRAK